MSPDRRSVLAFAAAAGATALAGCTNIGILGGGPGITLEYRVRHSIPHREMPEEVLTSDHPPTYEWAVVHVRLTEGTLEAAKFFTHTHFEVNQQYDYPCVAVQIASPEDRWIMSEDDDYEMEATTEAKVYYRYDEDYFSPYMFRKGDLEQEGVTFKENADLDVSAE